jgi:TetR/AcrR family transcriptional regulator, cholesterol catabolism regulator
MPRNHRELDAGEKREAIVAAARRLFLTEGYEATGMARIANEAGVAPNTLYWYFDDKDALLVATLERLIGEASREYAKLRSAPLHARLLWMLAQAERLPGLVATVHARAAVSPCVRVWHDRFHELLEETVANDLAQHGVPKSERVFAARVAILLVEGLLSHPAGTQAQRDAMVRFATKLLTSAAAMAGGSRDAPARPERPASTPKRPRRPPARKPEQPRER